MRQVVRKGLKDIIVDEVPDPLLIPQHLLVRPIYSLISSGTEIASVHQEGVIRAVAENPSHLGKIWNAVKTQGPIQTLSEVRAKFNEYAVLGYSGAGIVVEESHTDLQIGDRVAYGGEGTGHGETILVGRNLAVKIPDNVPFEHACFATLGSIALNAIRIARISLGESVVVIGLGLVGQLVAQLAKLQGGFVIATDLKRDRVDLARHNGSDVSIGGDNSREQIAAVTKGQGADCVIIAAAAKSAAPCQLAIDICRDRGRIIDVGAVALDLPWYEMYRKEIQLLMARAYGPGSYDPFYEQDGHDYPLPYVRWTENRNMQEFLNLISRNRVQVGPLVTHEFALEEASKAYETILDPHSNSLAVLLRYPGAGSQNAVADFQPNRKVPVNRAAGSKSSLGVALVGAGNLAKWVHLPILKKVNSVSLRCIHSSNGPRGKSYALRFGAEYCTSDYSQVLQDPHVQVVVIASRNQLHASQAIAALRAGKHVFVEKPMALTEQECRELVEAAAQSDKHLMVGFNRRFSPSYAALKKRLAERNGPVVLSCRVNSPGISGSYWMADPVIGGAIVGEACHFVDLMYWLLEAEPIAVSAYSLPFSNKEPIGQNNIVASFKFADGSIGNLTYCTVGSRTSGGERVEAFAPGLGARAEDFKHFASFTAIARKKNSWFGEKGYATQIQLFLESVREGRTPPVTVRDGARATLACLSILESAAKSQPCEINLDAVLMPPSQ